MYFYLFFYIEKTEGIDYLISRGNSGRNDSTR